VPVRLGRLQRGSCQKPARCGSAHPYQRQNLDDITAMLMETTLDAWSFSLRRTRFSAIRSKKSLSITWPGTASPY
jgi:hypothetical protein